VAFDALPITTLIASVLGQKHWPHGCLGVAPDASFETVRKRYLSLVLRLHPDKCSHPQAKDAFEAVEAAYRRLEDAMGSA
jgi:DnaJ-class molecular chaperone